MRKIAYQRSEKCDIGQVSGIVYTWGVNNVNFIFLILIQCIRFVWRYFSENTRDLSIPGRGRQATGPS
ncbi:hypothetical protein BHS30_10860 [Klebsiella pneumoniae]|nr:hypothetical protein BHS30_10860 [Klebsiella pneumoniae]